MRAGSILVSALIASVLVASVVDAQDREAAEKAHDRGDYVAERKILQPLAEAGDRRAQLKLGFLYVYGQGGPVDMVSAMDWFMRSAEQNDGYGQYQLSEMYSDGRGSPVDYGKAYFWISLASQNRQGPAPAQKYYRREAYKARLTIEQRTTIDKDVVAWRQKHPLPPDMAIKPMGPNDMVFPSVDHPDVFTGSPSK